MPDKSPSSRASYSACQEVLSVPPWAHGSSLITKVHVMFCPKKDCYCHSFCSNVSLSSKQSKYLGLKLSHSLTQATCLKQTSSSTHRCWFSREGHLDHWRLRGCLCGLQGPVDGNCCLQPHVPSKAHLSGA